MLRFKRVVVDRLRLTMVLLAIGLEWWPAGRAESEWQSGKSEDS